MEEIGQWPTERVDLPLLMNGCFAPTAAVPYRSFREAQSDRGHGFTPERYHQAQNLPGRILRSTSSGLSLPAMCSPAQNASSEPTARSYGLRGD
jgi:hypothetical protein